jgi:hypothetical protein
MTIFQAPKYDPARERRRRNIVIISIVVVLVLAGVGWYFRHWREEHVVDQFLSAIEQHDYEKAYGIWNADPEWKQHPQKYENYNFGTFELDWGPSGEYGEIKHHKIRTTLNPPRGGSGVLVVVMINDRHEPLVLWVEKGSHAITFKPPTMNVNITE